MSDPAIALSFFDGTHAVHGVARTGATLLFEDGVAETVTEGPEVAFGTDVYDARLTDRFQLRFTGVTAPVELSGQQVQVCRVEGLVGDRRVDGLGTAATTEDPPAWDELDGLRSICALFDPENALVGTARRRRGAAGHGDEEIEAWLLTDGALLAVEEVRLSTVYDGDGRQRSAGLELWLPGEEVPRRAAGTALAGTTLDLEALRVHAAVFRWRMEGREGAGSYEVVERLGALAPA